MNKENTEMFFSRFKFFGHDRWGTLPFNEAIRGTLMPFGFECGDGWKDLILGLCIAIEPLCGPKAEVAQVKEKFGGLRFYMDGVTEEVFKLINEAESKSFEICEECGKTGRLRDERYWVYTACDECEAERWQVELALRKEAASPRAARSE